MSFLRPLSRAAALAGAALALTAAPSSAVVGGSDASPGEYPAVAEVTFGAFGCTGTLISPDTVLTAGHCSSLTGGAGVATPAAYPPALISVRLGNHQSGTGGETVRVSSVKMHRNYLATNGYDISLLKLSAPAKTAPVKVAGASEEGIWSPGTLGTIVGWGLTSENGEAPDTLQEAQVPITTHEYCNDAYDGDIDEATMVCAGYPEGGVDTCQGDSGGPMFGRSATGALRVVGATSFGTGCAREGIPGVYARVGGAVLREWIRANDADGVA